MDTEKLKTLLLAVETGSLSAAADALAYTPSGVSKMIRALEADCGFPLLARSKYGVHLTADGERLLPIIKELLYWESQWRDTANDIRGLVVGDVTVGTAYGLYYEWLSNLIADFKQEYPAVHVRLLFDTSTELALALEAREADFCIISRRQGDFDTLPVIDDQLMAVLPESHPLAEAEAYPIERFAEESFIDIYPGLETDNSRFFAKHDIHPATSYSAIDSNAASYLVQSALGVSLLNALHTRSIRARVVYKPLAPKQFIEIVLAYPKTHLRSPAAARFILFAMDRLDRLPQ